MLSIQEEKCWRNVLSFIQYTMLTGRKKSAKPCLWLALKLSQKILITEWKWELGNKFKNREKRNQVILKQAELKSKGDDLLALQSFQSLFINDNMCFKNRVRFYQCQQLKILSIIFSYCFFLTIRYLKIYHSCDLQSLLQVVNLN